MVRGYIKLFRSIKNSRFWERRRPVSKFQALIDLAISASYRPLKWAIGNQTIHVPRNGLLTSQDKLSAAWRWDRKKVREFLRCAEQANILHIKTKRGKEVGYTLIVMENISAFDADSNGEPWPNDEGEVVGDSPLSPHTQEVEDLSLGRMLSTYEPLKSELPDLELDREAAAADEIDPTDYLSMHTGIAEAALLRKLPPSTLTFVAYIKRTWGKRARVIEFKPRVKPQAVEPEQHRMGLGYGARPAVRGR